MRENKQPRSKLSPQLGKDITKLNPKELKEVQTSDLAIAIKYDGACVIFDFDYLYGLHVYTREGKSIHLGDYQVELQKVFGYIRPADRFQLITEITIGDGKLGCRNASNGWVLSAIAKYKKLESTDIPKGLVFRIFDYNNPAKALSFSQRVDILLRIFKTAGIMPVMEVVESKNVSFLEAENLTKEWILQGYEGAMLYLPFRNYSEGKRNNSYVKLKSVNRVTAKILDTTKGKGKYLGKIGALVCWCESEKVFVNVGSGLDDFYREKPKEFFIGKFCFIGFESKSPTGELLQPVFKGFVGGV